jgi:sulfotransferase family protein
MRSKPRTLERMYKESRRELALRLRRLYAPARMLPDFLVIGARKAGTTSLYFYLIDHPSVLPAWKKEIRFFNGRFSRGVDWYRAHFAPEACKRLLECRHGFPPVTGEATPDYLTHPRAAERVRRVLPQAKLLVTLRDPVDRAFSDYQHRVRKGVENRSFEAAVEEEMTWLESRREKLGGLDALPRSDLSGKSYLTRSLYVVWLKLWMEVFPREQFCVLDSDRLAMDPAASTQEVFEFLRISAWRSQQYRRHQSGSYSRMEPGTRARLVEFFEPYNRRLSALLGTSFGWNSRCTGRENTPVIEPESSTAKAPECASFT